MLPRTGIIYVYCVQVVHGDEPVAVPAEILDSVVFVPIVEKFAIQVVGAKALILVQRAGRKGLPISRPDATANGLSRTVEFFH